MSTRPEPSNEEIALAKTVAGELKYAVKNLDQHAKDALMAAHTEIIGTIPDFNNYDDPDGHPEILDDIFYPRYVLLRRELAAAYLTNIIVKNPVKAKAYYEIARLKLESIQKDYVNILMAGGDTGIENAASSLPTVKSARKSYPYNPDANRVRPETMMHGI